MITGEVFQVGGPQLTAPQDAAIDLISFDGHAALSMPVAAAPTKRSSAISKRQA